MEPVQNPVTPPAEPMDEQIAKTPKQKREEREKANLAADESAQKAIATIGAVGESAMMPFAPKTFEEAWKLAHHLSNSNVVSDGLKGNAGAVLSVMATGMELGVHWAIAVQVAYVVYGRVSWPAQMLAALVDNMPDFEYFEVVEADNKHAIVEAKKTRWTSPKQYEVTIEMAQAMGFMDGKHSQLWKSARPMPMLIAMARREAARLWAPGRTLGLMTPDELDIERMRNVTPGAPPVAVSDVLGLPAAETATAADPSRLSSAQVNRLRAEIARQGVSLQAVEGEYGEYLADITVQGLDAKALEADIVRTIRELAEAGKGEKQLPLGKK